MYWLTMRRVVTESPSNKRASCAVSAARHRKHILGLRILTPAARFGSTPLPKMSAMFSNIDSHDLPAITSSLNAISDPAVLLNLDYQICAANDAYRPTAATAEAILQRHCYAGSKGA